tara:strand:+ start:1127 stop:1435 length:309 start_codon:yes stop_codon:yes gene_type:complete
MLTCNPYDALTNKNQLQLIKAKVLIYLPSEYITPILSIIQTQSTTFATITKIRYDERTKLLSFKGNKCDVDLYKDFIKNSMENTFMHYLMNEYGNIGKWADI